MKTKIGIVIGLVAVGLFIFFIARPKVQTESLTCADSSYNYFNQAFASAQLKGFAAQGYTSYNKSGGECVGHYIFKNNQAQIEEIVIVNTSTFSNSQVMAVAVTPPEQANTVCATIPGGCVTPDSFRAGANSIFVCKDSKYQDCYQMLFGSNQKIRYPVGYKK